MFLIAVAITWLGYKFGEAQGWWGSMRSGGGSSGGSGGGTISSGPRSPGVRSSGPKGGPARGSGAVRGLGSRVGKALGWRDAKRIHDRDEPPVTWGDAWREGLDSGRERGRERYDEGQKRKLEREQQRQWLDQAEQRSGELPDGAEVPIMGRVFRGMERQRTCPDCGHGNSLNDSRASCSCSRDDCACGTDAAPIGPDDEDERPDYSAPIDDEQRWGPAEDADDPFDEVAEKRRERDPAVPADDEEFRPFADGDQVEDLGSGRRGRVRVHESDPEDIAEGAPAVRTTVLWDPHPDSPNLTVEDEIDDDDRGRLLLLPDPTDSTPPGDGDTPNKENDMSAPTAPSPNMSGEIINFDSARDVLRGISNKMQNLSDASVETANEHRGTVAACDAAIAGLSSIDSDQETIGDFIALREQAQEALEAAEKAQVEAAESAGYATTVIGNIDQRHGAIEEAVRAAKHAAKIDAYKAS